MDLEVIFDEVCGALWMAFGTAAGRGVHAADLERLGGNAGGGVTAEVRAGETLGCTAGAGAARSRAISATGATGLTSAAGRGS